MRDEVIITLGVGLGALAALLSRLGYVVLKRRRKAALHHEKFENETIANPDLTVTDGDCDEEQGSFGKNSVESQINNEMPGKRRPDFEIEGMDAVLQGISTLDIQRAESSLSRLSRNSASSYNTGARHTLDVHQCTSYICETCRKVQEPCFMAVGWDLEDDNMSQVSALQVGSLPKRWWETDRQTQASKCNETKDSSRRQGLNLVCK